MDMGTHLNCLPNFNDMDFFEFLSKYEILKNKLKDKKGSVGDFLQNFKSFLGK